MYLGKQLTIDGAIKHCEERIRNNDTSKADIQEYATILVWLEELKQLRKFKYDVVKAFTNNI